MADERPSDDKQIEDILSDLDNILSDLKETDASAHEMVTAPPPPPASNIVPPPSINLAPPAAKPPAPAPAAKPPVPAPVAKPPAPAPAAKPPAPVAKPPAPAPVAKPTAPPQPPKPAAPPPPEPAKPLPYAKPQPGAILVPTPAPPAAKPPVVNPDPMVERFPETPKPAAAPPPPAPTPGLKIELAPREGTLPPIKKEPTIPPKKTGGLPSSNPMEIALPGGAPPSPAAPKVEPPKVEMPATPPAPISPEAPAADDGVPPNTPKEHIRRVAALYLNAYAPKIKEFFEFLGTSAQTVSKKPLFLRRALLMTIDAGTEVPAIIGRVQDSKAVSVLAVVEGLPEERRRQLAAAFKEAKIDFREVAPDDMLKRSAAVDILVEIMLLPSEL